MAFKLIGYRSVYIWYLVGELLRHDVVTKCVSTHFSFPSLSRVDSTTRGVRVLVRSRRHLDVLFFLFLCQHALSPFPTPQRFQEAGKHTHTQRERRRQTEQNRSEQEQQKGVIVLDRGEETVVVAAAAASAAVSGRRRLHELVRETYPPACGGTTTA